MNISETIKEYNKYRVLSIAEISASTEYRCLRSFSVFMRDCDIKEVQLRDIVEWLGLLQQVGYEPQTSRKWAQAIKTFFSYCQKLNMSSFAYDLIPVPRREFKFPRVAQEDDYRKLIESIPDGVNGIRDRALVNMLWDTGARIGEVLSIDMDDIDLEGMSAKIKTEKSRGKRPFRRIFWRKETDVSLRVWIKEKDKQLSKRSVESVAVFMGFGRGVHAKKFGHRLTIYGVGQILRKYSHDAGITVMNAHSLRHHAGHEIINRGGSAADVMNILGHSSLASSSIYTMTHGKELEDRYRAILGS